MKKNIIKWIIAMSLLLFINNYGDPTIQALGSFGGELDYMSVEGDYLYASTGGMLKIYDISQGDLTEVSSTNLGTILEAWIYSDNKLYGVSNEDEFVIVDVANPHSVSLLNSPLSLTEGAHTYSVTMNGLYVYLSFAVMINEGGSYVNHYYIHVLNVSEPANPIFSKELEVDNLLRDIAANQGYLYCVENFNLLTYDLSQPANPVLAHTLPFNGQGKRLVVSDHLGYLAHGGVGIVDFSQPASPSFKSEFAPAIDNHTYYTANQLAIHGNRLYLGTSTDQLFIYDVSNSLSPVYINHSELEDGSYHTTFLGVSYSYLMFGVPNHSKQIQIFDVSQDGFNDKSSTTGPGDVNSLVHDDGRLFISDNSGILSYDVQDPGNLVLLSSFTQWVGLKNLQAGNDALWGMIDFSWGDPSMGIYSMSIDDEGALSPSLSYSVDEGEQILFYRVEGNDIYVYVLMNGEGSGKLLVLENTGAALIKKGELALTGEVYDMGVHGNSLFMVYAVSNEDNGVWVIDVSDKSNPALSSEFVTRHRPNCLKIANSTLFVGSNETTTNTDGNWFIEAYRLGSPYEYVTETTGSGLIWDMDYINDVILASTTGGCVHLISWDLQGFIIGMICHSLGSGEMTTTGTDEDGNGTVYTREGTGYVSCFSHSKKKDFLFRQNRNYGEEERKGRITGSYGHTHFYGDYGVVSQSYRIPPKQCEDPPTVEIDVEEIVACGEHPVTVTAITSGSVCGVEIDFGDGSPVYSSDTKYYANHTYTESGNYEIKVTAKGCDPCDDAIARKTLAVNVIKAPTCDLNVSLGADKKTVSVSYSASNHCGLAISWGKGAVENLNQDQGNLTKEYAANGKYTITLTAKGCEPCPDCVSSEEVTVSGGVDCELEAAFSITYHHPPCEKYLVGIPVRFDNQSLATPTGANFSWVFGDGATASSGNCGIEDQMHIYRVPGEYTIVMTATSCDPCDLQAAASTKITVANSVTVNGVNVGADSWEDLGSCKLKGAGNVRIGNYVKVDGYVIIPKERNAIESGQGKVTFTTSLKEINAFTGSFSMPDKEVIPSDESRKARPNQSAGMDLTSEDIGKFPVTGLEIKGIDASSGTMKLNYITRKLPADLPGLTFAGGGAIEFVFKEGEDFTINAQGELGGELLEGKELEIAEIKFALSKISLGGTVNLGSIEIEEFGVEYPEMLGGASIEGGFGEITITADGKIGFGEGRAKIRFPDMKIKSFGVKEPYLMFQYKTIKELKTAGLGEYYSEGIWILGGGAVFEFPAGKSKDNTCELQVEVELYAGSPYFHRGFIRLANCLKIPIAPYTFISAVSLEVVLEAGTGGSVQSVEVTGSVDIDVGPEIGPLGPPFQAIPSTTINTEGIWVLEGLFKVFGSEFANAYFKLDVSDPDWVKVEGNASVELPPAVPVFVGEVEGKVHAGRRFRFYFSGNLKMYIPEKVLLGFLPRSPLELMGVFAQIGQFRVGGRDPWGAQAGAKILEAYADSWWCWGCPHQIAAFVSLEGDFSFGTNIYPLIQFRKKTALRRLRVREEVYPRTRLRQSSLADTVYMDIPENASEAVVFKLESIHSELPRWVVFNPSGEAFNSAELPDDSDLKGDSVLMMILENRPGTWKAVVSNIDNRDDYSLEAHFFHGTPSFSINNLEHEDSMVTIHYSADNPEDSARIRFYYSTVENEKKRRLLKRINSEDTLKTDLTSTGDPINEDWITARGDSLSFVWNTATVKNGAYAVWGMVSDGKNSPVTKFYEDTIVVNNQTEPVAPDNLRAYNDGGRVRVLWEGESRPYYEMVVVRGGSVSDTISVTHENMGEFPVFNDTLQYAVKVRAGDINGNFGPYSGMLEFRLDELTTDNEAPGVPLAPDVVTVIDSAFEKSSIQLTWSKETGMSGYFVYVGGKPEWPYQYVDVGDTASYEIQGLSAGADYYISLAAYDDAGNLSERSNEVKVCLYPMDDNDLDGLIDEKEIFYFNKLDFCDDSTEDHDEDGLSCGAELALGTHPLRYDTDDDRVWDDVDENPLKNRDADQDFMSDDWEVYYEIEVPDDDKDGDGLENKEEYRYRTNPLNADTDGGGKNDGEEIESGLDPLDPDDDSENALIAVVEDFSGCWEDQIVSLSWTFKEGYSFQGFNLYGKQAGEDYYRKLNVDSVLYQGDSVYAYQDSAASTDEENMYLLEALSLSGRKDSVAFTSVSGTTGLKEKTSPGKTGIVSVFPNPFNDELNIKYYVEGKYAADQRELFVYNSIGRKVRHIKNSHGGSGEYEVAWNGKNDEGKTVNSGVYFIKLKIGELEFVRQVTFIK